MIRRRRNWIIGSLVFAAVVPMVVQRASAEPPVPAPAAQARTSTSQQRKEVGITVYNDGFGLVREVRDVEMASGRVALEFRDVSTQIQPETVAIKPKSGGRLNVLEQNYR